MKVSVTLQIIGITALLFVVTPHAQEAPPAEYVQAMTDVRDAAQVLNGFNESLDFEAASLAAQSAATALEYVQQFWEGRDGDAERLAGLAWKAARDVRVAADLNSPEGVAYAATEMTETCSSCHTDHRERLEDGTFVIK